jgi:hypothetical protein
MRTNDLSILLYNCEISLDTTSLSHNSNLIHIAREFI